MNIVVEDPKFKVGQIIIDNNGKRWEIYRIDIHIKDAMSVNRVSYSYKCYCDKDVRPKQFKGLFFPRFSIITLEDGDIVREADDISAKK